MIYDYCSRRQFIKLLSEVKGQFPITMETSALHHNVLIGLGSLANSLVEQGANNLISIMGKDGPTSKSISYHWADWQLKKGSILAPVLAPHLVGVNKLHEEPNSNWAIFILWQLKLLDIDIILPDAYYQLKCDR